MARSRNLKPGFFKNERLAELNPLARLLFAGLWTLADREGRLEDRPKRIKAEILPYDDCDVNALLDELQDGREQFILRYGINGNQYIQVMNFVKHQNPHMKEQASVIPAPCKNGASTVQEQNEHRSCPADSLNPITDSLNIDSFKPESDASAAAIINSFSNNIHPITPIERDKLLAYLDDGFDHVLILYAIERAVTKGVRNLAYIEGILKDLRGKDLMTMQAVEAAERDYQSKKGNGQKSREPTGEKVRGEIPFESVPPPDDEQVRKNQEFLRELSLNIGKVIS